MVDPFASNEKRNVQAVENLEIDIVNVVHFNNLYEFIHDWLVKEGWADTDGDKDHFEHLYYERRPDDEIKWHNIWWRVEQQGNNAAYNYWKFVLYVDYITLGIKKHEMAIDNKKYKLNKGELIIRLNAWVVLDPDNKWQDSAILTYFEERFRERWFKSKISSLKKQLYDDMNRLLNEVKQSLNLNTPFDMQKPFLPERAIY